MDLKPSFGFDIGTEFVNSVVLDGRGKLVLAGEPRMHFGNPSGTLVSLLEEMDSKGLRVEDGVVAFTGDGGKTLASVTNSAFFYDTITIPLGANFLDPKARYVFHIGARDPYFFETDIIDVSGEKRFFVPDHETGTKCGGGSGILITKQCRRLFEKSVPPGGDFQARLVQMYGLAQDAARGADKKIDVGGRCGVVIQSDMIHLQNSGERIENILYGMFNRIAKNFQSDVVRVRTLDRKEYGVATGGVFGNPLLVDMIEKHLGVSVKCPEYFQHVGAIGAALKARSSLHGV